MAAHKIEMTFLPDGKMQMKIIGVKGAACQQIAKPFQEMGEVEVDEQTEEAFQVAASTRTTVTTGR